MNTFKYYYLLCLVVVFSGCQTEDDKDVLEPLPPLAANTADVVSGNNTFAFDFLRTVSDLEQENPNYMVSPLSLSLALGMLLNGAEGATEEQISTVLVYRDQGENGLNKINQGIISRLQNGDMNIANSIWIKEDFPVLDEFLNLNQTYYSAEANNLDFNSSEAVKTINQWVSDKTNGKIPKILESIPGDAVMYLINALYFNATWKYEFDPKNNFKDQFHLNADESIEVEMMSLRRKDLSYFKHDFFESLRLPYTGDKYSITLILPAAEKNVEDIVSILNGEEWATWQAGYTETEASISLPKFKFDYEKNLRKHFEALGLRDLFFNPDLSGINATERLAVSEVLQKTFIDVNEKGTEAAAVISIGIVLTSMPSYPRLFFNKPFLFAITERDTQSICFIGKVGKPEY